MSIRKKRKYIKHIMIYTIILLLGFIISKYLCLDEKIIKYIQFDTTKFLFKDVLSMAITVLAIFIGAVITIATVLISMCDKRIIKLINKYKKSEQLVNIIKEALFLGIVSIAILAVIYCQLDFRIIQLRLVLLYVAGIVLVEFIIKTNILVRLVINILNDAFVEESLIVEGKFVSQNGMKSKIKSNVTKNESEK